MCMPGHGTVLAMLTDQYTHIYQGATGDVVKFFKAILHFQLRTTIHNQYSSLNLCGEISSYTLIIPIIAH